MTEKEVTKKREADKNKEESMAKKWKRHQRRKKVVGHKPVLWDLPMIRQRQFPLWVSSSLDIALPLMMTSFFLSLSFSQENGIKRTILFS